MSRNELTYVGPTLLDLEARGFHGFPKTDDLCAAWTHMIPIHQLSCFVEPLLMSAGPFAAARVVGIALSTQTEHSDASPVRGARGRPRTVRGPQRARVY